MKRLLSVIVVLIIGTTAAMAQKTYYDKGVDSKLNSKIDLKKNAFSIDLGLGTAAEIGIRATHNFNQYIGWDILSARYDYGLVHFSHQAIVTTGLRGYTPSFGKQKNGKAYLNFALGYAGYAYESKYYYSKTWVNTMDVELGLGVYLSKHFFLGPHFNFLVLDDSKDFWQAMLRFGIEF